MYTLSEKATNRIKHCLQKTPLSVFDYDLKSNSNEVLQTILDSCFDNVTSNDCNIFDSWICSSNPELSKLFVSINKFGFSELLNISKKTIVDPNYLNGVVIRTIFGATEELSFKSLAYLLPALTLCEEIKTISEKNNIYNLTLPNIEFWFMNGAGININNMNKTNCDLTTNTFISLAYSYISCFHSSILQNVNFYTDEDYTNNIINSTEFINIQDYLFSIINKDTELKNKILEMGLSKSGSINECLKYTTLHYFVQDGFIDTSFARMSKSNKKENANEQHTIISIGASPEKHFFKARDSIRNSIPHISYFTPAKTIQYIAKFNVPPYYIMENGDFSIKDALADPNIFKIASQLKNSFNDFSPYSTPVQKACKLILQDTGGDPSTVCAWLKKFKSNI